MKYCIEVMRGPRPTYIVNGQSVGTTIADVRRAVVGPPVKMIAEACKVARGNGLEFYIFETILGWRTFHR